MRNSKCYVYILRRKTKSIYLTLSDFNEIRDWFLDRISEAQIKNTKVFVVDNPEIFSLSTTIPLQTNDIIIAIDNADNVYKFLEQVLSTFITSGVYSFCYNNEEVIIGPVSCELDLKTGENENMLDDLF
jgi:hypothetical protein